MNNSLRFITINQHLEFKVKIIFKTILITGFTSYSNRHLHDGVILLL